jgi:hypothetical protein
VHELGEVRAGLGRTPSSKAAAGKAEASRAASREENELRRAGL